MAAVLLRTTPLSQRGGARAVVVLDFPETPHQTRDNTDFPRPLRKSEARLRLACPPLAWRNGAPHERGAGGESDPRFFAADAPRGRTKVAAKVAALCPPCEEVALTTVIPGGKAIEPARRPEPGSGEGTDHSSPTGHDRYQEDRGLYPRCPTRGTSRLLAGRRFRAESIRSDSTIDASIHGQEGPPKSDSKRWV